MAQYQYLTARQVKELAKLNTTRARKATGLFLAEGEHMVEESIRERHAKYLLCADNCVDKYQKLLDGKLPIYLLSPASLSKISDTKTPQGIFAVCDIPKPTNHLGKKVIALNALQDPGNVGTILRTMDAVGFDTLIVDEKTADPYSSKAMRASMGAIFRISIVQSQSLVDEIKKLKDYNILAGALEGKSLYNTQMTGKPICILIGNEGKGLDQELLNLTDSLIKIPIPGQAESLNAAIAAAVFMYEHLKQEQNI
jgi:TrmH family RNA methyltransferase